jgi:predicted branched-subunit amino acid permease
VTDAQAASVGDRGHDRKEPPVSILAPTRTANPHHAAVRDVAPVLVGLGPFAVVVGVAMAETGLELWSTLTVSFLLYGGSVQLAMIAVAAGGGGVVAAAVGAVLVNERLLLYGASLATHFRVQPRWFRWLAPHFVVDQTTALATGRDDLDEPRRFRRYWLTVATAVTICWLVGITAGTTLGPLFPAQSPLEVTTVALFVALLVPRLRDRPAAVAAVTASGVTVATTWLPAGTGLLLAIGAGVVVAVVVTRPGGDR